MKSLATLSHKQIVIGLLTLLLSGKILFTGDISFLIQATSAIVLSIVLHGVFRKFFPRIFTDIRNSLIIGAISALIISNNTDGVYGILSFGVFLIVTFLLRILLRHNGYPVFNSVAIGSLALICINKIYNTELFVGWSGVNYGVEVFGTNINFGTYVSIIGALLLVFLSKKYLYALTFFITFGTLGYFLLGMEDISYLFLDGTLYFYFGYMVLEPKTGVAGKYQGVYGILLGILLVLLLENRISGDYIYSICIINFLYFIGKNYIHPHLPNSSSYTKGQKWLCVPCGYIYDPEIGDVDSGIPPGTEFVDIPNSWYCPVCGVSKADFIPLNEASVSKKYIAKIIGKIYLNPVTIELTIETDTLLSSNSGQFMTFHWKDSAGDFTRSYSIAEQDGKKYTFLIKLTEKGRGSQLLRALEQGEKISIYGVSGKFILSKNTHPKIFIATGTGLAPIYRMLRSLPKKSTAKLYFSVATSSELFYTEELAKIEGLTTQIHITREKTSQFKYGRVDSKNIPAEKNTEWYLCGSPHMVQENKRILETRGFTQIYCEEFE